MPTENDLNSSNPDEVPGLSQPFDESDEAADDSPRRAASARFIVEGQVGSDAAMRDAMDPANQSLADALRLSFRVLQAVIVVLIALFLVSGFQTVDEGQSGVRTVWGRIVADDAAEGLEPGAKFSIYPYPIGEFVLFRDSNRLVDLQTAFAPMFPTTMTHEQKLERADINMPLQPGRDGSLLTRDGDLAHLELSATYGIQHVGSFVRRVNDSDAKRNADRIVKLAVQKAAIEVIAVSSLQELLDQPEDKRVRIQERAQHVLDELESGIEITLVQIQRAYAPLAIEKSLGDLQAARVAAAEAVDKARQRANETLTNIAGKNYGQLIALIEEHEAALERKEEERAAELLAAINARFEDNDGDVSKIVQSAKAYQAQVESTLGNDYRRFASLLPAYRSNPQLLIRQQWLDAYSRVISRPDAEMIFVPDPLMTMTLSINGSAEVQEIRRLDEIARREQQTNASDPFSTYIKRGSDMNIRRMLEVKDGKVVPIGSQK